MLLLSLIIFKAKVYLLLWYEEPGLSTDWRIETSENGWTTDTIGLSWLENVFIPYTKQFSVGKYSLLVMDGHGSHCTPHFDKLSADNNIITICLLLALLIVQRFSSNALDCLFGPSDFARLN